MAAKPLPRLILACPRCAGQDKIKDKIIILVPGHGRLSHALISGRRPEAAGGRRGGWFN